MSHRDKHVKLSAWVPAEEAEAFQKLADANARSVSAELRLLIRTALSWQTVVTTRTEEA